MKLTKTGAALLAQVGGEVKLFCKRLVPYPHRYYVGRPEVSDMKEVSQAAIGKLLKEGYLRSEPQDDVWDYIVFPVTPSGEAALKAFYPHMAKAKRGSE